MTFKPKYEQPTERLSVRVPLDVHAAIKQRAKKTKASKTDVVVDALRADLIDSEPAAESAFG